MHFRRLAIHFAPIILAVLSACTTAQPTPPVMQSSPRVGGPCKYDTVQGYYEVTRVLTAEQANQVLGADGTSHVYATFAFHGAPAVEMDKNLVAYEPLHVAVGQKVSGSRALISSGTCTPTSYDIEIDGARHRLSWQVLK